MFQIELESFAVAWILEKFCHFLYGKRFQLETDQMPLENVLAKSLTQATTRILYLLMRTLPFHLNVRNIWAKGLQY